MPRDLHRLAKNLGERPPWLDDVDAKVMLEEIGVGRIYKSSMDEWLFSCPFDGHAHGDERPSAYMNNGAKVPGKNTVWKCHGCGRAGNAISFVAEYEGISRQRATRELRERFAPGWHKPRGGSMRAEFELRKKNANALYEDEHPEILILPWDVYKRFEVSWPDFEDLDEPDIRYMYDRGFTTSDLMEWKIGYDHASDRITIPVTTPDGQLVGIKGRAWSERVRMKYRILGDTERTIRHSGVEYYFAPYLKSQVVFGIDKWGEQDVYVWDEGEINVISWWKMNVPAFATGSAHLSDAQARIIRDYADEVVMFIDPDSAGETGMWGYTDKDDVYHPGAVEKLGPHMRIRIAAPHTKDANDLLVEGRANHARKLIREAKPHWRLQAPVA